MRCIMRKVWVVMDDGTELDAVFTTKTATMKYIKLKWPDGKFAQKSRFHLLYEVTDEYFVTAFLRQVNQGYRIEVPF